MNKRILIFLIVFFTISSVFAENKDEIQFGIRAEVVDTIENPSTIIFPPPVHGVGFRGLYLEGLNYFGRDNWGFKYEVFSGDSYPDGDGDITRKLEIKLGFKKKY